jgi:hypothetical protein
MRIWQITQITAELGETVLVRESVLKWLFV